MTKRVFWSLGLMLAATPGIAWAHTAPPDVIRGTIAAVTPHTLNITASDGGNITVELLPAVTVTDILPATLAQVKPGSYVGTAAVKQPDGTYRALELQVFPESMRGIGLGTRPWSLAPGSSMTNGTVSVAQTNGTVGSVGQDGAVTLTVNDGTGVKTVLVPAVVPVVTYAPGSLAELQPGAHVILFAQRDSSGHLTAGRVQVGKNGLTPPM